MSRRKRIFIIAGAVLVLALLVPCIHHWRLRAAAEAYVAELKARGEPIDLAQVIPPAVPPERNGAPLITNALDRLPTSCIATTNAPPAMRMVALGKAMMAWQQPAIRAIYWATNSWEDLGDEMNDARTDLAQFRSLIDRPVLDFNLDYHQGPALQFPHLAKLKQAAQWLLSSALYNLHRGKPADACTDVRAMLAMVEGEADERLGISQLVRMAIADMALAATWEILQYPGVSDADLVRLQQHWQSLEFISPLERALLVERINHQQAARKTLRIIHEFRQSLAQLIRQAQDDTPDKVSYSKKMLAWIQFKWDEAQWRWFWSYEDEVRGLEAWQVVIGATRMMETNSSFQQARTFAHSNFVRLGFETEAGEAERGNYLDADKPLDRRRIFSEVSYSSFKMLAKAATTETRRNLVVAAIAFKRFELRHHRLPSTLGELTPDLLKSTPTDYMDGQPLRYLLTENDGFVLYSVGEDGRDDGGDPRPPGESTSVAWQRGRDWVWPMPATAEELQAYDAKISSKSH